MKFLKTKLLALGLVGLLAADGHARPRLIPRRTCVSPAPVRVVVPAPQYDTIPAPVVPVPAIPPQGPTVGEVSLAQRHAEAQARTGVMHHSGQFAPGSSREGVGFSTVSPQHAVQSSCYWGRRTPTQIGVSRGAGGWFATVQYR